MRTLVLLAAAVSAVALPSVALTAGGKVFFEDTVPSGASSSVTIQTHRSPAFRVLLRVPTQGRAKLFLSGRSLHRSSPLMDTKTTDCEGAAGSYYCRAAYESLPKGMYTWRIRWLGKLPAHVELTVRW